MFTAADLSRRPIARRFVLSFYSFTPRKGKFVNLTPRCVSEEGEGEKIFRNVTGSGPEARAANGARPAGLGPAPLRPAPPRTAAGLPRPGAAAGLSCAQCPVRARAAAALGAPPGPGGCFLPFFPSAGCGCRRRGKYLPGNVRTLRGALVRGCCLWISGS